MGGVVLACQADVVGVCVLAPIIRLDVGDGIAPWEPMTAQSSAGGLLPFGFCWQAVTISGDVHDDFALTCSHRAVICGVAGRESVLLAPGIAPFNGVKPADFLDRMMGADAATDWEVGIPVRQSPSPDLLPQRLRRFVFGHVKRTDRDLTDGRISLPIQGVTHGKNASGNQRKLGGNVDSLHCSFRAIASSERVGGERAGVLRGGRVDYGDLRWR